MLENPYVVALLPHLLQARPRNNLCWDPTWLYFHRNITKRNNDIEKVQMIAKRNVRVVAAGRAAPLLKLQQPHQKVGCSWRKSGSEELLAWLPHVHTYTSYRHHCVTTIQTWKFHYFVFLLFIFLKGIFTVLSRSPLIIISCDNLYNCTSCI